MRWKELIHQPATLTETVESALREALVSGLVRPGQKLIEAEIAREMGISRGPVREAIRMLEARGLVTIHPRKGAFATEIFVKDVEELYSLRALLESFAIKQAMENGAFEPSDVQCLQQLVDQMTSARKRQDSLQRMELDIQFHRLIWRKCDHGLLLDLLSNLQPQIDRFMFLSDLYESDPDQVAAMHQTIVDAVRKCNVDEAVTAVRQHMIQAKELIIEKLVGKLVASDGNGGAPHFLDTFDLWEL